MAASTENPILGNRFEDCLVLAFRAHRKQIRKSDATPYVAHLLSVSALVLEAGGDEDEACAALLHDAVEDCGVSLETIAECFGGRVSVIVAGCTEPTDATGTKLPWMARKEAYLAHLATASVSVLRVVGADKCHNARTLVSSLHVKGPAFFGSFGAPAPMTVWFYRSCGEALVNHTDRAVATFGKDIMALADEMAAFLPKESP